MTRDYTALAGNPVRDFFFPDRIARVEFIIRSVVLNIVFAFLFNPVEAAVYAGTASVPVFIYGLIIVVSYLGLSIVSIVLPRLRDLRWNPKWAWLMLVPVANIVLGLQLVLTPGKSKNKSSNP